MSLMNLITFLIKGVAISEYDPAEDMIEGGIDFLSNPIRSFIKKYRESVNVQLKKESFTDDQIKVIKKILAESNSRFITNTPAFIGDKNADSMVISRMIFDDFKKANISSSDLAIYLEDEEQSENIIKGISIVISPVVSAQVMTAEYAIYLTKELKKANRTAIDNKKELKDHDIQLADYSNRINNLEQAGTQSRGSLENRINEYQKYVADCYEKHNTGNELLGEESLAELYMQPFYYKSEEEMGDVEQLFEEFIAKEDCGVLWIVGEPGHGKTSMCIKAVTDYTNRKRYQQARGVFWFRLNPQGNSEMVKPKTLVLEKVFSWGRIAGYRSKTIEPREIEGSLVFLDGFDELKTSLEEHGISSNQFYEQVNQLAQEFQMHIVVTSRTRALEQEDSCKEYQLRRGDVKITCNLSDGGVLKNHIRLLAPLTHKQQTTWINELISFRKKNGVDVSGLERYKHAFLSLQENVDMAGLLKVPILLRMIVQKCFVPSSDNRVNLYRDLFDKTLLRQGLYNQREDLHSIYRDIAFRIFVFDDDCVDINKADFKGITDRDAWLYQYYLYTPKVESGQDKADIYRITFIHRSFYQYFLSEFFYEKIKLVTDSQSGENFLKYMWPRHMDPYVMDNLRLRVKDEDIDYTRVLKAIDETDAILSEHNNSACSKESIGSYDKANNIFWNAISVLNRILENKDPQQKMKLSGRVIELLPKYSCSGVLLRNSFLSRSDLSGSDLRKSDLSGSDLSGANLSGSDLSDANLSGSNLSHANLSHANLSHANLTHVNLSDADLSHANLSEANLSCTNLIGANLRGSNLNHAILSGSDLSRAVLNGTNLSGTKLIEANLSHADLSDASLSYADLSGTNLGHTNLSHAVLYYTFMSRANLSGANLFEANLRRAILQNTELGYTNLSRANLSNVDMRGASLSNAILSRANLIGANLNKANLSNTVLSRANLRGAKLRGVNLVGANLKKANLSGATLIGTDLRYTHFIETDFEYVRISKNQYEYISRQDIKSIDKVSIIDDN